MRPDLQVLEAALGHTFINRDLLVRALTHKSLASEQRTLGRAAEDNEQLEFLGDAVLGFVTSEWLVEQYPDQPEGKLSVLRASLVSAAHLQEVARRLGLGDFLQLGRGEEKGGGRAKNRLLANAVEALLAAVYVDAGIEAARQVVVQHIIGDSDPQALVCDEHMNYKGPLQERAQRMGLPAPRYSVAAASGPEHAKLFTVEVRVGTELVTRGEGPSKKVAGQNAARAMLERLDGPDPSESARV